jgi:hypothetical protein
MRHKSFMAVGAIFVSVVFMIAIGTTAAAQGKGHGGGGGRGASPGGPPSGVGVERGIGRSSDASMGRADIGRDTASTKSRGRSDAGLERARIASDNLRNADRELRRHPKLASDLRVTANDLRSSYQAALVTNPNLTFGQYVAATRLANNLGGRNPNITRNAILAGLASGDSLGRTLRNLGLGKDEANAALKEAERQNKYSKR